METKSHYFKLFKRGLISHHVYSETRNRINRLIDKAKLDYYKSYFSSNFKYPFKLWRGIKNLMDVNIGSSSVKEISIDGNIFSDPVDIASKFNEYFSCKTF